MMHIKCWELRWAHSKHSRNFFHLCHHHIIIMSNEEHRIIFGKCWTHVFYSYQPEAREKKKQKQSGKKKSLLGSQSRVSTLEASCKFRSRLGFGKCQGLYIPVRRKWNVPLGDFYCKLWVIHEFKAHLNLFLIRKNFGWLGYGSYRLLRYLWRPSGDGLSLPL